MNGASKILTVSYGTFSCTLEGFDDPFNTMKAIAEYFRDLAADDRYFGAEPVTPDAAMLHRIAEREIQRRVESKIQDNGNGVVLRAAEAPMAAPRITMPAAEAAVAAPPHAQPTVASMTQDHGVESAAARLSRLRAAQMQMPAAPTNPLPSITSRFVDIQAYAEDQDAETAPLPVSVAKVVLPPQVQAAPIPTAKPVAAAAPVVQPEPVATAVETSPDSVEAQAEESPIIMIAPPEPEPTVAADTNAVAEPDAPSDWSMDNVLASVRESLAGQDDQLAEDIAAASDQPLAEAEVDLSALADPVDYEDLTLTTGENVFADAETDMQDLADLGALDAAAPPTPLEQELVALVDIAVEPVAEAITEPATPEPAPEMVAQALIAPEPLVVTDRLQRARARVNKIRRHDKAPAATNAADTLAALTDAEGDHSEEPASATPPAPQPDQSALSAEAEAALQHDLAALSAQIGPVESLGVEPAAVPTLDLSFEASLDAALADELATAVIEADKTDKLPAPVTDDAAVERILAQTNTQLEVPETKRRRSAIAHLKAAVLATVADRKINPNASKNEAAVRMNPYRQDLNQAVRPTPVADRPASDRPAPLVLVSAQRIDRPRDAAADAQRPVPQIVPNTNPTPIPAAAVLHPVRPRRVTSSGPVGNLAFAPQPARDISDDLTADDLEQVFATASKQSFAEFADRLGAASLPELMEAAGAYCTLVLDTPSFTRPQLFKQMQQMPELAEMSREDSLRGFGKLLRDGRIQKSVRGQFTLSEASSLLHEARRIAG